MKGSVFPFRKEFRMSNRTKSHKDEKFSFGTLQTVLKVQQRIFETYTGAAIPAALVTEVMGKIAAALVKGSLSPDQGDQVIERAVAAYKARVAP